MYDRPETAAANDRLWSLIRAGLRDAGVDAPEALTRGEAAYWPAWQSAELVLSQTCGLPFRARLHDRVTLIGTPDYGVEGCLPGYYRSVFVVRADETRSFPEDFATARFALNDGMSQSGWAAPKAWFAQRGLSLTGGLITGAHAASARAVAGGQADFAALDAVTWSMITEFDPVATHLRVVGYTDQSPGLPFITAPCHAPQPFFDAVSSAITALGAADRQLLRLHGIVRLSQQDYLALPIPSAPDQIGQSDLSDL